MAFQNLGDSLQVPAGAAPNESAIVIGTDIPAELRSYYSDIAAAVIYRYSDTQYAYSAMVRFGTSVCRVDGIVNTAQTPAVREGLGFEYMAGAILHLGGAFGLPVDVVNVNSLTLSARGFYAETATFNKDVRFNGTNANGLVARGFASNPTSPNVVATATDVESVIITVPSTTYAANRSYRIEIRANVTASVALDLIARVRKGSLAGSGVYAWARKPVPAGNNYDYNLTGEFNTGPNPVTTALVFTATTLVAGSTCQFKGAVGGAAAPPVTVEIFDMDIANSYPGAFALT